MNESNRGFLNELKNEHKVVGRFLEDIKGFIQTKDAQGVVTRMGSLKSSLLAHLKKEDDKVYAELTMVAKEQKIQMVEITVNTFSTAMKGIATRILKFFDRYPNMDEIATRLATEFHKDFQGVYDDILKRVKNEETVLYPMYEKYCC